MHRTTGKTQYLYLMVYVSIICKVTQILFLNVPMYSVFYTTMKTLSLRTLTYRLYNYTFKLISRNQSNKKIKTSVNFNIINYNIYRS